MVVSDTHGYTGNLYRAVEQAGKIDLLIHLGDVCNDEREIYNRLQCGVKILRGNNDWNRDLAEKAIIPIGENKIFATHGHKYNVYWSVDSLFYAAMSEGCNIILYGHTHVPHMEQEGETLILNPGSLTYPRGKEHKPSYAIIEFHDDDSFNCEIFFLED